MRGTVGDSMANISFGEIVGGGERQVGMEVGRFVGWVIRT